MREGESDHIEKVNSEVSVHSGPVGLISDRDKGCFQTKFLKKNQKVFRICVAEITEIIHGKLA